MADYRYRDRDRGSSIFSDDDRDDRSRDDRWRGGAHQHDDRGFFARAGDEVRSWFGDEEAERRREQDARQWEREHGTSGAYRGGEHEDQWTGRPVADRSEDRWSRPGARDAYARSRMSPDRPSFGDGQGDRSRGFGGRQSFGGAPHDESYRRWRAQQIAQLDSEYDDYCRHRQQQFEQDFSTFRQSRQAGGQQTSGSDTLSAANTLAGQSADDGAANSTGRKSQQNN